MNCYSNQVLGDLMVYFGSSFHNFPVEVGLLKTFSHYNSKFAANILRQKKSVWLLISPLKIVTLPSIACCEHITTQSVQNWFVIFLLPLLFPDSVIQNCCDLSTYFDYTAKNLHKVLKSLTSFRTDIRHDATNLQSVNNSVKTFNKITPR